MGLMKMFGLTTVAAMVSIAFVGATSASAISGKPCAEHTSLTCSSVVEDVSVVNSGVVKLLNSLATILCLSYSSKLTYLKKVGPFTFLVGLASNCGTNSGHTNCELELSGLPFSGNLSKTGLDQGTLTSEGGELLVFCEDVFFTTDIECTYDTTGLTLSVGAQHLTATETPLDEIGSDFLCPNSPTFDALLETTSNVYILQ